MRRSSGSPASGVSRLTSGFRWNAGEIKRNARELERKIDVGIGIIAEKNAAEGTALMKTTAPWTDRTGAARTGLHTSTGKRGDAHVITFAHAVYYGIFLEVCNSGKYQVIMPSVQEQGAQAMKDLDGLMRRLR